MIINGKEFSEEEIRNGAIAGWTFEDLEKLSRCEDLSYREIKQFVMMPWHLISDDE